MKLTICICTWNRAKLLRQTLESMTALRAPVGVGWNIVVVNNNCTDETDAVVGEFMDRLPLVLMHEPTPGKSSALNRALDQADCDWMVFTDDDVQVESVWLQHYAAAMNAAGPDVAFLGGAVEPWFEVPPSTALATGIPTVGNGFCGVSVKETREICRRSDGLPVGANCAVHVRLASTQRFDPRLGPKGKQRIVSEEYEYLSSLLQRGFKGVWVAGVSVRHYVPAERLTLKSLMRHIFDLGRMEVVLKGVPEGRRLFGVPMWVVRELIESTLVAPLCLLGMNRSGFFRNLSKMSSRAGIGWQCLLARDATAIRSV